MHWLGFTRLMREIFNRKTPPDPLAIARRGLLAVKIGQTYALRPDFLPEANCTALGTLYRRVPPVAPAVLEKLLGALPEGFLDRFETFERVPFASASIGQAHRGRLPGGREVVIKLVRPDLARPFLRDVAAVRRLLNLAVFFSPRLKRVADPQGILESIRAATVAELDLRNEAAGQDTLRAIRDEGAAQFDLSMLEFPQLHRELSGQDVLVSDLVPGETLDALLDRGAFPYERLLDLFRIHGYFIFCVGTFHGDIHPGNIIWHRDRFWFVDTGVISTVSRRLAHGLFAFFEALSAWDYPASAAALNRMAERGIEGERYAVFQKKFLELYADFKGKTVSQVSLTRRMMETIRLGVLSGMRFERGMYPVIKSMMYLDGMVLRANPQAVLLPDMRRFIAEFRPFLPEDHDAD